MIAEYRRKSNIAAVIYIIGGIAYTLLLPDQNSAWSILAIVVLMLTAVAFGYSLWAYAKGKGYSGALVVTLGLLLNLLGLIVLVLLRDKTEPSKPNNDGDYRVNK